MITCPKCKNTLPDWAQTCQFCGSDTSLVARPAPSSGQARVRGSARTLPWIWPAYYAISWWYVLNGAFDVFEGFQVEKSNSLLANAGPNYFLIVFGILIILWGLGLVAKIELVRGITNVLCFLAIGAGLLRLVGLVLSAGFVAIFGGAFLVIVSMFMTVFNIAASGLMIYLIGETD